MNENFKKIFPDDWMSAFTNSRIINKFIKENEASGIIGRAIIDVILIISSFITTLFFKLDVMFVKSVLTVSGILTGFVINAIMFTGRDGDVENLSYEQMNVFSEKIKFLLWSQISTLKVYLSCIVVSLIYLFFCESRSVFFINFMTILLLWLVLYAIMRTSTLPFQIYDMHAYNLEQIEGRKMKEAEDKASRAGGG